MDEQINYKDTAEALYDANQILKEDNQFKDEEIKVLKSHLGGYQASEKIRREKGEEKEKAS